MATAVRTRTTEAEYLQSSYQPDCDLIDGELQERNAGEFDHGLMQLAIGSWFLQHSAEWAVIPISEMRMRPRSKRYRVADIAVVSLRGLKEDVLVTPPVIVIEILSPEDRISRYKERLEDYIQMGVKNVWVVDPVKKELSDCSSGSWILKGRLEVPGAPIYLTLDALTIPAMNP